MLLWYDFLLDRKLFLTKKIGRMDEGKRMRLERWGKEEDLAEAKPARS